MGGGSLVQVERRVPGRPVASIRFGP